MLSSALGRVCGAAVLVIALCLLSACGRGGGGGGGGGNGDTTAPHITSTNPVSGAANVGIGPTGITAEFSEAMNAASLATAYTLSGPGGLVNGSVTYGGTSATFTPSAALNHATTYTATVSTAARDSAGNAMAAAHSWTFTTVPAPDTTRPVVSSTSPAPNAAAVATNAAISVRFSEPMNCASLAGAFTLDNGASGPITCAGTTVTLTPSAPLLNATAYTATVTTGAADPAGNTLETNFVWSFTTAAAPDGTAPTVSATNPPSAATGVSTNTNIGATFSEAMDPATITTSTFTLTGPGGWVAGSVSYHGVTASFTPTGALADSTSYTATLTTGARDAAGNALASNYVWSFTTAAAPDTTAPAVTGTSPVHGGIGVGTNAAITATFSEPMDAASITSLTMSLRNSLTNTAVTGNVTYNAGTAMFAPHTALANSTGYTVTITTGARDTAGNTLAANYEWSFTTAATPDIVAPTVDSVSPLAGALNVSTGTVVSATFSEAMNSASLSTATFTLSPAVAGTVSYAGTTATFVPSAGLANSTLYTATIASSATDTAGNPLAAAHVWSFTTEAAPDTTSPTIAARTPAPGATGVAVNTTISAAFSEPVNCATVSSASFTLVRTAGSVPVGGSVSCGGASANLTPAGLLAGSTQYTATLTSAIADMAGNPLIAGNWNFTTVAVPWRAQLGTAANDVAEDIALDSSNNVFVVGSTQGALGDGATNAGGWDVFVAKLDTTGTRLWAQQLGSNGDDFAQAVATDSAGNVYVAGYTLGNMDGLSSGATVDLFVAKYSAGGVQQWVRQFGSPFNDFAYGIAVNANDVYVTGFTFGALDGESNGGNGDAFLIKYDANGNRVWTRLLGTAAEDVARDVGIDAGGNVYLVGYTLGTLPGEALGGAYDYFISRYAANGDRQWARQFGAGSSELGHGIAVSGADIYISGHTSVATLVAQHAAATGDHSWTQNLNSPPGQHNSSRRIAVGTNGVYAVGRTDGSVDGNVGAGASDLFLVKYDTLGVKQWSRQFGSGVDDVGLGVATDSNGDVFASGYTLGDLDGNTNAGAGTSDPFVLKYDSAGVKQ